MSANRSALPPGARVIRLCALEGGGPPSPRPGDRVMAFHIRRWARDRYRVADHLFTLTGNVVFTDFHAVRLLAQAMNAHRDLAGFPERAVRAGHLNAMGLIDEILHHVAAQYRAQRSARAFTDALARLDTALGRAAVDAVLRRFTELFPPPAVYRGEIDAAAHLAGATAGVSHRELALEEVLLLWLANANPAFTPFNELFNDAELALETPYPRVIEALADFFAEQPVFGPDHQSLVVMLRSPALAVPYDLLGQLDWIRERWGLLLHDYLLRLLSGLDLVREEERAAGGGAGPAQVLRFDAAGGWAGAEPEPERFTPDRDWMPRLVLIAKSTYVWLDQLSRRYGRPIRTLDAIPDEELDRLARWGFTGLWLIGVWERSRASRQIKQMCGNPEAMASAYSLAGYAIAEDLGGEAALDNLRHRAWGRGIRLAADMVPNHMGIDAPWVREHPDWFIQLDHSPFPVYSYNGPNLSGDDRHGIYVEDHYFQRTDAAVTFKWTDRHTGATRYIYHGNDGTNMPWNDTAQLNYLLPEVREAAIQAILSVARRFPVIRFDAAMTLTKRHYHRLWYPEPGAGGDIPSRAGRGLTKADFDRAMPNEFWREVVDRLAAEAPDTLLLAEAFWLMEGYFVRTLGMHRVYNSAFMNFLKNEDNDKFRLSVRNVLEFNPEILKRFVNFLNNPDEETAVAQFGKGDKYLGVTLLMVTMPGLPMFGHGQIEGFSEKYGMEYPRAYWDERPDEGLVQAHERLIFPLMRRRHVFAEVRHFLLYDLYTAAGAVDENVIAYSNRHGDERALVVFHNKYASTAGWIRESAAYLDGAAGEAERRLVRRSLGDGLGLADSDRHFAIFRDHVTGLEFIRASRDIHRQGLFVDLHAYQYQVFLDFREVDDSAHGHYARLAAFLEGRGVPSIDAALQELFLQPIQGAFERLLEPGRLRAGLPDAPAGAWAADDATLDALAADAAALLAEIRAFKRGAGDPAAAAAAVRADLAAVFGLPERLARLARLDDPAVTGGARHLQAACESTWMTGLDLALWSVLRRLGDALGAHDPELSRSLLHELRFARLVHRAGEALGLSEEDVRRRLALVRVLLSHAGWMERAAAAVSGGAGLPLAELVADPDLPAFIQVNRWQDVLWFNRECFEELADHLLAVAVVAAAAARPGEPAATADALHRYWPVRQRLQAAIEASGYQLQHLMDLAGGPGAHPATGSGATTE